MKAVMRFFLSLRTTFGLFSSFILIAFCGSLMLPGNLAFFSGIDETPLFDWLASAGSVRLTWWIYGLIGVLGVLALNTAFCTVDGIRRKTGAGNLAASLAPQVMHIGVLFVMLGHLLTASMGFKTDLPLSLGEEESFSPGLSLLLEDVTARTDKNDYVTDWEVRLRWLDKGMAPIERTLRPAHPLYIGRYGLYSQSINMDPGPSAVIRISRDPGAPWALIGGIVMCAGGIVFVWTRFLPNKKKL